MLTPDDPAIGHVTGTVSARRLGRSESLNQVSSLSCTRGLPRSVLGLAPSRHPRPAFQGADPAGARRVAVTVTLGNQAGGGRRGGARLAPGRGRRAERVHPRAGAPRRRRTSLKPSHGSDTRPTACWWQLVRVAQAVPVGRLSQPPHPTGLSSVLRQARLLRALHECRRGSG